MKHQVLLMLATLLLSACQAPALESCQLIDAPKQAPVNVSRLDLKAQSGKGFTLQLGRSQATFSLKHVFSEVDKLRIWLVHSNTGALTPAYGPFDLSVSFSASGDTHSVYFDNVPAGSYYVAAAALNNTGTNITEDAANPATISGTPVFVTSGGGEGSFPGRVTIGSAPNYNVTGTPVLTMTLVLD